MTPPVQIQRASTPPVPRLIRTPVLQSRVPELDFFVHPHIFPDNDPCKGRLLRASQAIPRGSVLLRDASFAIVPIRHTSEAGTSLLCSNLTCSKRILLSGKSAVKCPCDCDKDVIWCDKACQAADHRRHDFECQWLKTLGQTIRRDETEYDFLTLWHVVRLLAGLKIEKDHRISNPRHQTPWDQRFKRNWAAVMMCCDYLDSWPQSQIKHWKRIVEVYLCDRQVLSHDLSADDLLSLLCKEETNTFGLYVRPNGPLSMAACQKPRGDSYGVSLFPRAAMFNHSCDPSVSHKPDDQCRMVFTAARDIAEGEECTITYLDLVEYQDLHKRQDFVEEQFQFLCTCDRCKEEELAENMAGMDLLPGGF